MYGESSLGREEGLNEVADRIRMIVDAGVALAERNLVVGGAEMSLQRDDAETRVLALTLVEPRRIEGVHAG